MIAQNFLLLSSQLAPRFDRFRVIFLSYFIHISFIFSSCFFKIWAQKEGERSSFQGRARKFHIYSRSRAPNFSNPTEAHDLSEFNTEASDWSEFSLDLCDWSEFLTEVCDWSEFFKNRDSVRSRVRDFIAPHQPTMAWALYRLRQNSWNGP